MKCKFKILAFLLAILLLLPTLSGCTGYLDPLGYLKDATIETIKSTLVGELLALFLDVTDKGMLSVEFGGTDLVQNLPDAAELKLWMDVDGQKIAADGKMTLAGEKYDIAAYLNETEMAVVSASFFGSNTLGVDFVSLEKDLKTSIFSNTSGTAFSDPTVSSASAERVKQIKKSFFELIASQDDTLDFADEVLDVFLEELTSYAENTRYKEDGYTHITLGINNDSLARTLRSARAVLVEDRSFCNYLNELGSTLDAMLSATTGVTSTEYSTKVKYFLSSEEDIDAICRRIDDAQPFRLQLKTKVKSFGMALTDVSVSFVQSDVTRLEATAHLDEDVFSLGVTWDGVARQLTYAVSEDGFSTYRAAFTYQKSSADVPVVEINGDLQANRRDDSYTLTLKKGNEVRVFGGSYSFDRDEMMLSVDRASINGESKRISLKVTALADESVPAIPDYVNVVAIDVARFTPIHERAVKTREQLQGAWEENGLSAQGFLSDLLTAVGLPEEIPQNS